MLYSSNTFSVLISDPPTPNFLRDGKCSKEILNYCNRSCKVGLVAYAEGRSTASWIKSPEPEQIACAKSLLKTVYESKDTSFQNALGGWYDSLSDIPKYDEKKDELKAKAVYWLKRAATQGHAESQIELGLIYKYQDGDPFAALGWFKKAAKLGNRTGQYELAEMYTEMENFRKAVSWHKKAAEQSFHGSWMRLANIYESGIGVPQNFVKAYAWRSILKSTYPNDGEEEMKRLKNKMTKEQIAKGQELASKCWESKFKDCD